MFKILPDVVLVDPTEFFSLCDLRALRGHPIMLAKSRVKTRVYLLKSLLLPYFLFLYILVAPYPTIITNLMKFSLTKLDASGLAPARSLHDQKAYIYFYYAMCMSTNG